MESDFWLHDALGSLLRRSWKTMPPHYRAQWILDILETPIPNDDEDGAISRYPEPGDLLRDVQRPPDRTPESESRWTKVVETLLRAADGSGEVRERASRRLARVASWGLLTEPEAMQAAAVWWGAEADENTPVPPLATLHDYAFIVLPEPRPGMGRRAFARKWLAGDASQIALTNLYGHGTVGLTAPEQNPRRADDILYQTGRAVAFMRHRERSLELSQSEQAFLTDVIDRWTENRCSVGPGFPRHGLYAVSYIHETCGCRTWGGCCPTCGCPLLWPKSSTGRQRSCTTRACQTRAFPLSRYCRES